jgi:hypothetical protein
MGKYRGMGYKSHVTVVIVINGISSNEIKAY